ncbi:MAG: FtsQ-type POTRA domain-containing protein [Aquificae bacterium]|nr:FtsQ-type POTRA domain-containing protein [Aquificota bacterium]
MQLDRRLKIFLFSAWLILCAVFGYFAPTIPMIRDFFAIKKVNVIGTDKFKKEDIEDIFSRENWFFLNTERIENQLKRYNFVKEVKIDRYFVGNINLTILERKPFAFLLHKGKRVLIDEDGVKLSKKYFNPKNYKNLPVIIYNDKSLINDNFSKVRKIYEALKGLKFKKYVISHSQIACVLEDKKILMFNILDIDENLEKAKLFISQKNINDYRYIDFSFDSMVVTRR